MADIPVLNSGALSGLTTSNIPITPNTLPYRRSDLLSKREALEALINSTNRAQTLSDSLARMNAAITQQKNIMDFGAEVQDRADVGSLMGLSRGGTLQPDPELDALFKRNLFSSGAKNLGAAADTARQGGLAINPGDFSKQLGMGVKPVPPTSVEAAEIRGQNAGQGAVARATVNGVQFQIPLEWNQLPPEVMNRILGTAPGAKNLSLTPQAQATLSTQLARLAKAGNQNFVTSTNQQGQTIVHFTDAAGQPQTLAILVDGRWGVVPGRVSAVQE